MEKDDIVYIDHILDAISAIEEYVKGLTFKDFIKPKNRIVQAAVIRELQVIGEAVKKLSKQIKKENPDIPWRDITGMRDKLTHEYFAVNLEVVWLTIEKDIPFLKKIAKELKTSQKEAA